MFVGNLDPTLQDVTYRDKPGRFEIAAGCFTSTTRSLRQVCAGAETLSLATCIGKHRLTRCGGSSGAASLQESALVLYQDQVLPYDVAWKPS